MKLEAKDLRDFVEGNPDLVRVNRSTSHPDLRVLKYRPRVHWDNLWTPELMEMRGLVVDNDYNVIARPLRKVFNAGERNAIERTEYDDDAVVSTFTKINGYMLSVTQDPKHGLVVATTGTLDSEFAAMGREALEAQRFVPHFREGFTYIFENCDTRDPHIIPEHPGLHYLGAREIETGRFFPTGHADSTDHALYPYPNDAHNRVPMFNHTAFQTTMTWGEAKRFVRSARFEGVMAYKMLPHLDVGEAPCIKLKSPFYLMSKFLARGGVAKLEPLLVKENLHALRSQFDEEFYPLLDFLVQNSRYFISSNEQDRLAIIRMFLFENNPLST